MGASQLGSFVYFSGKPFVHIDGLNAARPTYYNKTILAMTLRPEHFNFGIIFL